MRGFLWCHGELQRARAKVASDSVCLPKGEGSLGIRRIEAFNNVLILSQVWNLLIRKDSLWVKWIHTYKLRGDSFWEVTCRANVTWSWRKILQIRPLIRRHIWVVIGNGMTTSAWYDNWCELSPLAAHLTNRMIARAGFQLNARVTELIEEEEWKWPIGWNIILQNMETPTIIETKDDQVLWKDRNGALIDFSVQSAWEDLRPRGNVVSWADIVWFPACIPKHSFILWIAVRRKLNTHDVICQWSSYSSQDPLVCTLCDTQPDSHNHLFFDCVYSKQVWNEVKIKAEMQTVSHAWDDIMAYLTPIARKKSIQSVVSKLLFAALVYYIWQERNARRVTKDRRSHRQLAAEIIKVVRYKMLTCRYKKTRQAERFLTAWDLPFSLLNNV